MIRSAGLAACLRLLCAGIAVMFGTGCGGGRPAQHAGGKRVSGRLDPKVIQAVVRSHYAQFRACYEAGLGRDPYLEGRVTVRFIIAIDGSVPHVSIVQVPSHDDVGRIPINPSTLPDTEVAKCIARELYRVRFPEPDGGIVTVVYPIAFSTHPEPKPSSKKPD